MLAPEANIYWAFLLFFVARCIGWFARMVFVGHTPQVKLSGLGNVYPIDTGALYADGHLTMVMLPNTAPVPFFIQNLNRFVEKDVMLTGTHMHRTR